MNDSSSAQHPIGSGFGARGTAVDVLEGVDPTGRLAPVTGGHSGPGPGTARPWVLPARPTGVNAFG
ncbi:hypothetical protein [Streptomyces sp. NPDC005009]